MLNNIFKAHPETSNQTNTSNQLNLHPGIQYPNQYNYQNFIFCEPSLTALEKIIKDTSKGTT